MKIVALPAAILLAAILPNQSLANCPGRTGVLHGDTLVSIAIGCGINVEMLKQANPGLSNDTLRAGTFVVIPNPPLPSSSLGIGNASVQVQPPLLPYQARQTTSTVILPPAHELMPAGQSTQGFTLMPSLFPPVAGQ